MTQTKQPPENPGRFTAHATIFPYGPFPAGDGHVVMLAIQNEREWTIFCEQVLQQAELAIASRFSSNTRRSAAREELREIIVQAFADLTGDEVMRRLDAADIANARVNDMHQVWKHPQLHARGRWTTIETPAGIVPALLPPGIPAAFEPRMGAVPAVGEHNGLILAELGYAPAKTEGLNVV